MFIKFKTMMTTKTLRALVVADEGNEVLVDLEKLGDWGILPSCFPLSCPLMRMTGRFAEK